MIWGGCSTALMSRNPVSSTWLAGTRLGYRGRSSSSSSSRQRPGKAAKGRARITPITLTAAGPRNEALAGGAVPLQPAPLQQRRQPLPGPVVEPDLEAPRPQVGGGGAAAVPGSEDGDALEGHRGVL